MFINKWGFPQFYEGYLYHFIFIRKKKGIFKTLLTPFVKFRSILFERNDQDLNFLDFLTK